MPSVSKKQHNLMAAVANNPAIAKKAHIPQSVGKEFLRADKGKTFNGGGMANTSRMNKLEELGRVDAEKAKTPKGKKNLMEEKKRVVSELKFAKGGVVGKMGKVKTAAPSRDGVAVKGKTKGRNLGNSGPTVGIQRGSGRGR